MLQVGCKYQKLYLFYFACSHSYVHPNMTQMIFQVRIFFGMLINSKMWMQSFTNQKRTQT